MTEAKFTPKEIEELTLLLLYLHSWKEKVKAQTGNLEIIRAWKGYDFDILDGLDKKGLIKDSKKGSKSIYITEKGIKKAKEIAEKYHN